MCLCVYVNFYIPTYKRMPFIFTAFNVIFVAVFGVIPLYKNIM